jgi:hypothetical protein
MKLAALLRLATRSVCNTYALPRPAVHGTRDVMGSVNRVTPKSEHNAARGMSPWSAMFSARYFKNS